MSATTPGYVPAMIIEGLRLERATDHAGLAAASDAELVDAVTSMALHLRALGVEALEALAAAAGLPLGEVLASPFAARAVAMAVGAGACTVQHELRTPLDWPEELSADPAVAADPHGYWDRGVLHAGKYRSFMQDEPFATYNPNHMAKWGPHELLHRACGFFWRAGASRWEFYLTARLNELVPVVLWYGLDEVARLDRLGFDRAREAADRDAPLPRCLWWTEPEDALRARVAGSIHSLREGLAHFAAETAAVDREIGEGRVVPVEHPFLDASSDAIAYVVGHYERLASERIARLGEAVWTGTPDVDPQVRSYRARVEAVLNRLLFGDLVIDLERAACLRAGMRVRDLALRTVLHPRWAERRGGAALDAAGDAVRACFAEAEAPAPSARRSRELEEGACAALLASLPRSASAAVAACAWPPDPLEPSRSEAIAGFAAVDVELLLDGLRSLCPGTLEALEALEWDPLELACLPRSRTDLAERIRAVVEPRRLQWLTDLLAFELAIARTVVRDDASERLGEPSVPEHGFVSRSRGFALHAFATDPGRAHLEWLEGIDECERRTGAAAYLVGATADGVSVVPAPACVQRLWEALESKTIDVASAAALADPESGGSTVEAGLPATGRAWLQELVTAGALRVVPAL